MKYVADVAKFPATRLFERPVGASRPGLLESGAYFLELAEVVSQLPPAEEEGGAGDSEVFDTKVNPEDHPVLGGVPLRIVLVPAETDMQEVVAVTGGERTFCDAPLVGVEVLSLVAIVGVGEGKRTPDATLCGGERHRIIIEQRHGPGVVFHRGCGEGGLTHLLALRLPFDTAGDGLCGLVGGENRVLTPKVGVFAHVVVGEGLYVAFGVTLSPRHVRGDLATALPLGDSIFEEVALLVRYLKSSDCRPTHVVACHVFNVIARLLTSWWLQPIRTRSSPPYSLPLVAP